MSELASDFQSLPPEYQGVIQLAQDQHGISVTPLQELVGGWSGAMVYLVSISFQTSRRVEHYVLKLDRRGKKARSDEIERHNLARSKSPIDFTQQYIPEILFDRVQSEEAIAIFYAIAGQSLRNYRPLSGYKRQDQLEVIFGETYRHILSEWNLETTSERVLHPQKLLHDWLGFRLDPGGNIERFIGETCQVKPDSPGFLLRGNVFPNPLRYARGEEPWGSVRQIEALFGLQHGDLNTNNILVNFSKDGKSLAGYYIIDFALFKEGMPLFFDLRYLEMSYLIVAASQSSFPACVDLMMRLSEEEVLDPHQVPIELAGAAATIRVGRMAFSEWIRQAYPSLHDDLWGQYWLAGIAAGLSYTHKAGQADEERLAGLIYAAANLKQFVRLFGLSMPAEAKQLYDEKSYDRSAVKRVSSGSPSGRIPNNLPASLTTFIGRAEELEKVKGMLLQPEVRLITLTGPGGTGKTRLSLRAAQEVLSRFEDGVFFVSLSDDFNSDQLISRIAQQLSVREGGWPLLENVKDYLRNKHLLLVLDNFEQLVSAAPVVADLLADAPGLKILTSSRMALNLRGEREFPVPPLALPEAAHDLTTQSLIGNEFVSLFVERAQAAQPSFTLTDENASVVAQICLQLDGLPLALELAAARVKLLPPQAILSRLGDRLKLLTGGARDLPARHQTLRNALEWSYGLLQEDEKVFYARLGVFVGGFTFEAVEAVCNSEGHLDVFESLNSLVNNSLVRQEATKEGEPRFRMLETILCVCGGTTRGQW